MYLTSSKLLLLCISLFLWNYNKNNLLFAIVTNLGLLPQCKYTVFKALFNRQPIQNCEKHMETLGQLCRHQTSNTVFICCHQNSFKNLIATIPHTCSINRITLKSYIKAHQKIKEGSRLLKYICKITLVFRCKIHMYNRSILYRKVWNLLAILYS